MRFVTITPNAAIDTTYWLDRLVPGQINRVDRVMPQPGGKGNNVARVLATLGHQPTATGFAGGHSGAATRRGFAGAGCRTGVCSDCGRDADLSDDRRKSSGRTTEIREPGAVLTDSDADRLLARLSDLVRAGDTVIISGASPPGLHPDVAARLIAAAEDGGSIRRLRRKWRCPAVWHSRPAEPDQTQPGRTLRLDRPPDPAMIRSSLSNIG